MRTFAPPRCRSRCGMTLSPTRILPRPQPTPEAYSVTAPETPFLTESRNCPSPSGLRTSAISTGLAGAGELDLPLAIRPLSAPRLEPGRVSVELVEPGAQLLPRPLGLGVEPLEVEDA